MAQLFPKNEIQFEERLFLNERIRFVYDEAIFKAFFKNRGTFIITYPQEVGERNPGFVKENIRTWNQ